MNNLQRRLERIGELKRLAEDGKITVPICVSKKLATRLRRREKHEVLVKGWPSETPNTDCELEERPGLGPDFDFGFKNRTIIVR